MKIVLVTGGFDPIHSGHIEYFKAARQLGDKLIVGLNSDSWLTRKKGQPFMPITERMSVIENLKMVDHCVIYDDNDGSSIEAINNVRTMYPNDTIIFANGGDRTATNVPEMIVKDVEFKFGVGGESKMNSSSWILREWKQPKTLRSWGYYRILHDVQGCKVKELTVEPGQSLSMQRHFKRHEFWHVTEGKCLLEQKLPGGYTLSPLEMSTFKQVQIPQGDWHRLSNPYDVPCKIVEIQYGEACDEEDIERQNNA
jgi:D-beta-D-heptose 7-phosphate kinase/D-beta-D-heptose 1-phosphate adenosyltransferase